MEQPEDGIVDRAKLAAMRAELGVNFARIFGYFLEDGAKSIAGIEAALGARSAAALVRPAHTLKGDSLQFGAERLGLLAEMIEKTARCAVEARDFPRGIDEQVDRLRPLFAQTVRLLRQEMNAAAPARRAMGFGRRMVAAR
jgi:HPt (histidine-containing phosphotransfer) domain-containing protein